VGSEPGKAAGAAAVMVKREMLAERTERNVVVCILTEVMVGLEVQRLKMLNKRKDGIV
jgi:hypothetical protein